MKPNLGAIAEYRKKVREYKEELKHFETAG